jgi:hypothetical protein
MRRVFALWLFDKRHVCVSRVNTHSLTSLRRFIVSVLIFDGDVESLCNQSPLIVLVEVFDLLDKGFSLSVFGVANLKSTWHNTLLV